MSDVIHLKTPRPQIWVCSCGCSSFELQSDGEARCCACEAIVEGPGQGWHAKVKDEPERDADLSAPFREIHGNNSVEFARARTRKIATRGDAVMLIAAMSDGTVSAWFDAEGDERVGWCRDRIDDAIALLDQISGKAKEGDEK